MDAICKKCRKRKSCKSPCRPVEQLIKGDSPAVFERRRRDGITIYSGSTRMVQRSDLSSGVDDRGDTRRSNREAEAFSTENENPFRHYEANHRQTSVFLKRFFAGWSYADIATAHDITERAAHGLYYAGCQRLLRVIIEMDFVHKSMTPAEQKRAAVVKSKRYLESHRDKVNAKRRERYQKNKARINAKRRAEYAKKSNQTD